MTSSAPRDAREVFVFCYLPGAVTPVVAGRFAHDATHRVGRFTYGRSYLGRADAVALDPIGLPLARGTVEVAGRLGGIPGALRDAAPDAWGRRVIERAAAVAGELPELTYLVESGSEGAGALAFGLDPSQPKSPRPHQGIQDLAALERAATLLDTEGGVTAATVKAAQLLAPTASMGGARPKATVADGDDLWIAKFPGRDDRFNYAAAEAGLLDLARQAGCAVPPIRVMTLGGRSIFLTRRFDRLPGDGGMTRARHLSALTVLGADETVTDRHDWSYLRLAEELRRRVEDPAGDRRELFRRMVFNALVTNTDDHPRNHAIIAATAEGWHLSPLFDVVPVPRLGAQEHDLAMTCGPYGTMARRANLVAGARTFGLTEVEAEALVTTMQALVGASWEDALSARGASQADLDAIRPAICPAGFEYPAPTP